MRLPLIQPPPTTPFGWHISAPPVPLLRSALLDGLDGLRHAFTTRNGGVSAAPYAALNLGLHVGDAAEAVVANRAAVAAALGLDAGALVLAEQVHGADVAVVGSADRGRGALRPATALPGCDVLVTAEPGVALVALAADCVPILLADPVRRTAAAVHAGWRGTVAGAAGAAVRAMAALGSRPGDVRAAIGPCIGVEHYDVGGNVADAAAAAWPDDAARWIVDRRGATAFDLAAANRDQLVAAGLAPDHVAMCGISTAGDVGTWFSHRAEGGRTGRQAGIVGWAPGTTG
ncbi:MAG: peptidoglycan editing factor PgeF [Ardenticatenales bacterium]|nr:peptidoglycan editing factor PgeF [Ardenticatenales bacterium]